MKILIVIPAYNEEKIIQTNVLTLYDFMKRHFTQEGWMIVVSDNNSSDHTKELITQLSQTRPNIQYFFVPKKGKGAAIKAAWLAYDADIYCFMDADLSSDLKSLPSLLQPIAQGRSDITCGSRFQHGAKVERSMFRKIVSRIYRLVLKVLLGLKTKDAPCGFKAISREIRNSLLPKVINDGWFFDSELIILSEKLGYRVEEIPVTWREPVETGRESQVKVFSLGMDYLYKVLEIKKRIKTLKK